MKPLVFVIAVGLATGTEAQTGPQSSPRPVDPPPAAEKAKAKDVPKMTTAEKNKMAKDVNKQMMNPNQINPDRPATTPNGSPLIGDFPTRVPPRADPFSRDPAPRPYIGPPDLKR